METTESKFTPGPWKVRTTDTEPDSIYKHSMWVGMERFRNNAICIWKEMRSGAKRGEQRQHLGFDATDTANAHLIAAAPDLYEACRQALQKFFLLANPDTESVMEELREALAKARGEAQ